MSHDPDRQDRMLELLFGLLPEEEAAELRAEIERDTDLAEAYAEAKATAELMGEAARLASPKIVLSIPPANVAGRDTTADSARPQPGPELAPWSPWAQWGIVAAAGLLVVGALFGWAQQRSQLADAGANNLRLQVTGPSQIQASVDNRYTITTTTGTGRPVSAKVHFAVYSPAGTRLLGHTERSGPDGALHVDIPANQELPPEVRLEIEAGEEQSRQSAESRVPVRHEPLSTHLTLDRSRYAPGETVRYRSVSLSRFHLEPERDLAVEFDIRGPLGSLVDGSRHEAVTSRGVAAGEFAIPNEAPGGIYTLVVSSPGSVFAPARREFLIEQRRSEELRKELEFAGSGYGPGMEVAAALRVTRPDGTPVSGAEVRLVARAAEETFYEESKRTDGNGGIAIGFHLPDQLGPESPSLRVTVDDGRLTETLVEPVPLGRGKIMVDYFPEGGDLAAVGENRVYFAARDEEGDPVELAGWIVDEDGNYQAVVETVHKGRGVFRFSPRVGVRYHLVLQSPRDVEVDGQLPFVIPSQKIVLNTGVGVFGPGKPIEFNVRASQAGLPLVATATCRGVQVGQQAFLTKPLENEAAQAANAVKIAVPDDVAGVIRLTVFDYRVSPPRPVAERLVYRRPLQRLKVSISADRETYAPGETCRLAANVTNEEGRPAASLLGLSVVDERALDRVETGPATMASYFWLASEVEHPQDLEDANFLLEDKPEAEVALDLLLGTQGWRRFAERSVEQLRENEANAERHDRLVALGAEATPPLMLDNLTTLQTSSRGVHASARDGSEEAGNVLGALIILAAAGLLVLVTMLSLLRIARGVRLWAPALVAVGASFFFVFLMMTPNRSSERAVAFASYRPPAASEPDENREKVVNLGIPVNDGTPAEKAEELAQPVAPPRSETVGGKRESADKEKFEAAEKGGEEDRKVKEQPPAAPAFERLTLPAEEPATNPAPMAEPSSVPADAPAHVLREATDESDMASQEKDRPAPPSEPEPKAAGQAARKPEPAKPAFETKKAPSPESESRTEGRGRGDVPQRSTEEKPSGEKRDSAKPSADRLFVREFYFDAKRAGKGSRKDFEKTVYWAPMLETDSNGHAEVNFDLSDSVTRFRAVADAIGDQRIGSTIEMIVSKLPFHLSPKLPGEVTLGDRVDIPVTVSREGTGKGDIRVELDTTDDLQVSDPRQRVATLGERSTGRLLFSAEAKKVTNRATLTFRGQDGKYVDSVEQVLRIESPGYAQTQVIGGILEYEQSVNLEIPQDVLDDTLDATLTVFPSVVADLRVGLESTAGQSFDASVASLTVADLLVDEIRQHGVADADGLRAAKQSRTEARNRLEEFKESKGGYSGSVGRPAEIAATAEALLALLLDRDTVGGDSIRVDSARRWLRSALDDPKGKPGEETAAEAIANSWAIWTLAEAGEDDLESILKDVVARAMDSQNGRQLALAALAADQLQQDDSAGKLLEALTHQQADDGHVGTEDESGVETTALANLAWLTRPPFAESASRASSWLLGHRDETGGFGSPRATALALRALAAQSENTPRAVAAGKLNVRRAAEVLVEREIDPDPRSAIVLKGFARDLAAGGNSLTLELTGGNRLPYTLVLRYSRQERPARTASCPLDLHTELEDSKVDESETTRVLVRLENVSEQVAVSPVVQVGLPAGLEIASSLLDAEKKAGRLLAYKTRPRRLFLHLRSLKAGERVELAFDATAHIPGQFSSPASFAYLQETPEARCWAEPLTVEIAPGE